MATAMETSAPLKIRIFVDFWNFQLTLNNKTGRQFRVDWLEVPKVLVQAGIDLLGNPNVMYDGTIFYTSFNPKSDIARKHRKWAVSWLDRQAGFQVKCFERRPKNHPKCPVCHKSVAVCPDTNCKADMAGTVEKGVDTAIATDMIRLAWEGAYEVAILCTADADLIPAVEFLDARGYRVLQAGFPPHGSHLSRACWATIDVTKLSTQFERL